MATDKIRQKLFDLPDEFLPEILEHPFDVDSLHAVEIAELSPYITILNTHGWEIHIVVSTLFGKELLEIPGPEKVSRH